MGVWIAVAAIFVAAGVVAHFVSTAITCRAWRELFRVPPPRERIRIEDRRSKVISLAFMAVLLALGVAVLVLAVRR
jgi:hypothetical protein